MSAIEINTQMTRKRRAKVMSRILACLVLMVTASVNIRLYAATNYEVGGCNPNYQNFPTIQAAVSGVPANSTILICPGIYPEQVTISQPLTLQGYAFGNAGRATIVLAPGGSLNWNALVYNDVYLHAQVLVQNVNPPGPVNITGITVDGSGAVAGSNFPFGCFDPQNTGTIVGLAGIVYDQGTTGTVNEVSTRKQQLSGCGFGVVAFNGTGAENITIENSSVHDVDNGIVTFGFSTPGSPATLSSTVYANFVTASGGNFGHIDSTQTGDSITSNFVAGSGSGVRVNFYPSTVASNTVADSTTGIDLRDSANPTAQANRIANSNTGVFIIGGAIPGQLWPAPTIQNNLVQHTNRGIDFATVSCPGGLVIDQNTFNDSALAFNNTPATLGGTNQLYNIDMILNTGTCP